MAKRLWQEGVFSKNYRQASYVVRGYIRQIQLQQGAAAASLKYSSEITTSTRTRSIEWRENIQNFVDSEIYTLLKY